MYLAVCFVFSRVAGVYGHPREAVLLISSVSRRRLAVLCFAIAGDLCFALLIRGHNLVEFMHGSRDIETLLALVALGWQALVIGAAVAVGASLLDARRDLHSRQQALVAVAATSPDWLWESDIEDRLTYNSAGVTQLLGYLPGELLGRASISLMPDRQRASAELLRRRSLADGTGWDGVEMTWLRADGSEITLHGNAGAVTDQHGRTVGFRGTRRAITLAEVTDRALAGARLRVTSILDAENLDVAMQPIVDMTSGLLVGVEALARFPDGRSPDIWFREAGDLGSALDLDRLAFRCAVSKLALLPDSCYLSVNATPEYVLSGLLTTDLVQADVPFERIVIEITEHARVGSYADLQAVLTPLRERGVRIAVDDTGAGYSSLTHVLQLRPSVIKIDRSLITDIANDAARRSLVTALVLLALDLGASVTGEGIETASELQTLGVLGVDAGQGYLLARPSTETTRWQAWGSRNWLLPAASAPQDSTPVRPRLV